METTNSRNSSQAGVKLGLALSGGGFRASLFHIGVLARLAELDILRSVEVLSTVSGGSIIGALYYLHLKNLLESKSDLEIEVGDYVSLVQKIEKTFLAGVQSNIRLRTLVNPLKNLKMLWQRAYSRSDRMAELYDLAFYNAAAKDSEMATRLCLDQLKIQPPDVREEFRPKQHNRSRRAKVPMLVLNATTLNTGRNWQFTAEEMGEWEPDEESREIDKNFLLLAFQYEGASLEKYRHVPLSIAVAASACVPGIFHPLPLTGLYRNVIPRLVDGGVNDNQGVGTILFEHCSDVIISDASGQMADKKSPSRFVAVVAMRARSILEDRVRDLGLESLATYLKAGLIENKLVLHLRDGLDVQIMKPREAKEAPNETKRQTLPYLVDQRVQRRLSAVRTDLDAFTEVEAYSLMYSGYALTEHKLLTNGIKKYAQGTSGTPAEWQFMKIRDFANSTTENKYYLRQLSIASKNLFRPLLLLRKRILLPVLLALAVGVYFAWTPAAAWLSKSLEEWWLLLGNCFKADCVGAGVLLALIALVFAIAIGSLLISVICWFNIRVMTPLFLHLGSLEYLKKRR